MDVYEVTKEKIDKPWDKAYLELLGNYVQMIDDFRKQMEAVILDYKASLIGVVALICGLISYAILDAVYQATS